MKRWSADVSRETRQSLEQLADLLVKWNQTVNLISRGDEKLLWERHILDSLQLATQMNPRPSRGIDFGSGAGFPGLVLALATGVPFELIEADHRKAAFLREATRITGAPARVHAVRIEAARLAPAPLITARGVADLPRLLDLAEPLLSPGGMCLFLKGANACPELTAAASRWHMRVQQIPSRTHRDASILRISELARAGG